MAVTLALTYPLLLQFTSVFPHDAGDPALNTWILWWNTKRVPFTEAWWNAPMFYPMPRALSLSEALIGLLPITALAQLVSGSPLVAYNVAFVLSFPLCALAAYALALELTGRRDAALVAGLAYAFAPYRMGQLSHIQVLSYYFAPLVFLSLHRYQRTRRRIWLAAFAASWLLQSLSNGYAMFHVGVFVALWFVWFCRPLSSAIPVVVSWGIGSLPLLPMLLVYRSVHSSLHLTRDVNEVRRFGADLADFVSAPQEVLLWGARLWPTRPETALFPGLTILLVGALAFLASRRAGGAEPLPRAMDRQVWIGISAVAALVAFSAITLGPWRIGPLTVTEFHKPFSIAVGARLLASIRGPWMRRAWRSRSVAAFYLVLVCIAYVLALGPEPRVFGRPILYEPPYAWLMRLPGFETLRVPARFAMLAVLGQSVLLAVAVASLRVFSRRSVAVALVVLGLLADGWIALPVVAAPRTGPTEWRGAAVVVELPAGGNHDFDALYRSIVHHLPIVNGYSSYAPPHYLPFVFAMRDGQFDALGQVPARGPIGVAVDLLAPTGRETAEALDRAPGIERQSSSDGWTTFLVASDVSATVPIGVEMSGLSLRANRNGQDTGTMTDRDVATGWASGTSQIGDEEITLTLASPRAIGAVVIDMGPYAFGFPRSLEVDTSTDGSAWSTVWRGPTATLTLGGALASPGAVPLTIDLGRVSARHVRLRQTGAEPGIPWWIAEVHLHAPAAGR